MTSQQARVDDKLSWPHFCVRQRRLREKRTWLNKKNSHPIAPLHLEGQLGILAFQSTGDSNLRDRTLVYANTFSRRAVR